MLEYRRQRTGKEKEEQMTRQITCRGLPFWSWNGKLEENELRRQIRIFREMGFGGFFIHARTGLATDYLGKEWFDALKICIDEARKVGLQPWLYDEDRYASGSGAGEIGKNIHYRRRSVEVEVLDKPEYRTDDLAWFAGKLSGTMLAESRRLEAGADLRPGESFLRFYVKFAEADSWNNGGYYSDMMNPDAMREFIRMTHERYAAEFGEEFGSVIPGLFTDEPNCSTWTENMEQKFEARYGVPLLDHLPELFFEVDGCECSKIRWQMVNLRAELLESAFAVPVSEWCRKHGLLYTGHVFGEENTVTQTKNTGNVMRFVRHMDIPGLDVLSDHQLIYEAVLQTASVARQNGTSRVLSESFAGSGWDLPLFAQKAGMDWQYALGVTVFCVHHAFYTLRGEAKRDFPPGISFQSPYWKQEKHLQDYAERLGRLLAEGEAVRPLLVVHPLESTWFWKPLDAYSRKDRETETRRLPRLRNALLRAGIGFDYGDELMMAENGSIENGQLRIGKAEYRAVLLPELRTIRRTTLALLERFADSGGTVFHTGPAPRYLDCAESGEPRRIYRKFMPVELDSLSGKFEDLKTVMLHGMENENLEPVLFREVKLGSGARLFLCNTGCPLPLDTDMNCRSAEERNLVFPRVTIRWKGVPELPPAELDLLTGKRYAVDAVFENGWWRFETSFGRLASRMFATEQGTTAERPAELNGTERIAAVLPGPMRIRLDEPNALPLDFAEYSVNGEPFRYDYICNIDSELRRRLGLLERGPEMVQPWKWKYLQENSHSAELRLRYRFQMRTVPVELALALEERGEYKIRVNGSLVEVPAEGWWCDSAIEKVRIPREFLKNGENVLELQCAFHGGMSGLEAVYLLGDFGVVENELTSPVRILNYGDWGLQGLPYYAGNISYFFDFEWNGASSAVFLRIQEWKGTALAVSVNGSEALPVLPEQNGLNIAPYLKSGLNILEIKVFGNRRNALGPLGGERGPLLCPGDFRYSDPVERRLKPYGLMKPVVLFVR